MRIDSFAAVITGVVLMTQGASAADINVFLTGAAKRAYETLAPQFERATGHKLITQSALPPDLGGPGTSAKLVSQGEVDFVVSGLPPLLGTPNIEWLGYLPAEINNWLAFSGALSPNAKQPEAGRALLNFLTTPAAVAVWKENGLEPVVP